MAKKSRNFDFETLCLSKINDVIISVVENHEGLCTIAAKRILYRLVELTLADRNETCLADCAGASVEFCMFDRIKIKMLTDSISLPLEDIKGGLNELHNIAFKVENDEQSRGFCFFNRISIHYSEPCTLEFVLDGAIWRGLCAYSNCFGMTHLMSHRNIFYDYHPIDKLDLYPECKEMDDEAIAQRLFDHWDEEEKNKKKRGRPKKSK